MPFELFQIELLITHLDGGGGKEEERRRRKAGLGKESKLEGKNKCIFHAYVN